MRRRSSSYAFRPARPIAAALAVTGAFLAACGDSVAPAGPGQNPDPGPSELELVLLEPIRDLVPPRVFTEEYKPQPYGGTGWHRDKLVKAARLLEEAGWVVEDGTLTHVDTGEEFFIRFPI